MEEESERIASLIQSLSHPDKKVTRDAADALISIAPDFPQLAEQLNRLIAETPAESRWPIAYVLGHISPASPSCLPLLTETLGSKDPDIRWAAARLLIRLGKGEHGIDALLIELLKSGSSTQRRMAAYCLRDLDLKDRPSLQALMESLRDPDPLVRVATVAGLKIRSDIGKDGLDYLLDLFLRDSDPRVRHTTALALAQLGAPSREIRQALEEASRSDEPQLKKAAVAALSLLQKKGPARIAR